MMQFANLETNKNNLQNFKRFEYFQLASIKRIYPTSSSPGKLYVTAKIHELSDRDGTEKLPKRPIISNLNTATYHLAKYLAKLLSPLSTSKYTV